MGLCIGMAVVLQIISVYPKIEVSFNKPPAEVHVVKECDTLPVSKSSTLVNKLIRQRWEVPPNITICPSSGLSVYRVERATRFWETLGYEFGSIRKIKESNYSCATGIPSFNEIMIDIPSQDFNFGEHLGSTRNWWVTSTGEILKSKIEIVSGWEDSQRIIEHELGHALGFKDNNVSGHMMNRAWTKGGYNSRGLRKQ